MTTPRYATVRWTLTGWCLMLAIVCLLDANKSRQILQLQARLLEDRALARKGMDRAMSFSTHTICDACWAMRVAAAGQPGREPVRAKPGVFPQEMPACCYCGQPTSSGIFVRDNDRGPKCEGHHAE